MYVIYLNRDGTEKGFVKISDSTFEDLELDNSDQIGVGLNYNVNGQITNELPFDINQEGITPDYIYHPGWNESLDDVTSVDGLPKNASDYLNALEKYLGVKISMVSTGPERRKLFAR